MIDIFGTLGPSCCDEKILEAMFAEGMTGIRINLSHVKLNECRDKVVLIKDAASKCGIIPKILIDMQGPELRIGNLEKTLNLDENDELILGEGGVPVDNAVVNAVSLGQEILLDDGKILATVTETNDTCFKTIVKRGGILSSRKSIAVVGQSIDMPAMTEDDIENIKVASELGIYGVMQPFVRSREDLLEVKQVLSKNGCEDLKIYAKIENKDGVANLESFMEACDEIIIARGDLGNSMPLWELPKVQKQISKKCNECHKPFMVVTQMLSSMEHSKVPTRAEVSDIYNAALDGASSVMVTGETAVGDYPIEVIKYLKKTVESAE